MRFLLHFSADSHFGKPVTFHNFDIHLTVLYNVQSCTFVQLLQSLYVLMYPRCTRFTQQSAH